MSGATAEGGRLSAGSGDDSIKITYHTVPLDALLRVASILPLFLQNTVVTLTPVALLRLVTLVAEVVGAGSGARLIRSFSGFWCHECLAPWKRVRQA